MRNGFCRLKAECLKVFGDVKIYWLNYLFGNLNVFFLFFGLFYTFSQNSADDWGKLLFLFGLMYWYFGVHAVDLVSLLIEEEIEQGTLEQLLMTCTPLAVSLFFRIVAQILFDLCKGVFVFALCMGAFGIDFSVVLCPQFGAALAVFFTALLAMYGLGYLVAGLSLLYKQASSIASVSSSLLLFFSGATIGPEAFPGAVQAVIRLFPFYWSSRVMERLFRPELGPAAASAAVLLLELALWGCGGLLAFHRCLAAVYQNGTTGSY